MTEVIELRGEVEFWARVGPLAESDAGEWVHIAHDLDTWPGAREAARRQMRLGKVPRARKLYSPAVLGGVSKVPHSTHGARHALSPHRPKTQVRPVRGLSSGTPRARTGPRGHRTGLSKHPLADERDREALREMAAHGFRIRIATAPLPQGTVIIDRRTMILTDPAASTPGARTPRTYTMSGSPALIGGTYSLFEAAWESAAELSTFLDPRRPRMDARTAKVLHALVSGATDEAAARELGMSLRTYRRRVAELLVSLDAASRFQAGVRAGELGLIRG
ncbi:DNA-binding response regulator [Streptomyces sp. SP17KL33]|uniref:DNA-binding response regulator n=1 Tax=Streptomyces sp. SP17KL33 TaxID=3002534 RepID=UPI002E775B5D|nr:DNA-binding response regulator [Streptomyces sp. SP17KL33]MEE1837178.1 DNA-binding response regulator [Streptomyces sp. SP17KL33]